jgi:hypothetical protein
MEVFRRKDERRTYNVVKLSKHAYAVVKILNIYESEDEAIDKWLRVGDKTITEEELLKEYTNSDW